MPNDFESFFSNVFRFALSLTGDRHLAEDLTQECFLKAQQRATQIKNKWRTKSWLFQILVNLWKDHLKKKRPKLLDFEASLHSSKSADPQSIEIQNENYKRLLAKMQQLPEQQRTVLFLKAVEELSIKEIATLLNKTENTVKANLSIARKTLRQRLAREETKKSKVK